jgi:hypothetical protein
MMGLWAHLKREETSDGSLDMEQGSELWSSLYSDLARLFW